MAYRGWHLVNSGQARKVTDWKRERMWGIVELKDHQQ